MASTSPGVSVPLLAHKLSTVSPSSSSITRKDAPSSVVSSSMTLTAPGWRTLLAMYPPRVNREGYMANTVRHPGAVSVIDDDTTEDGASFLVMELLEGETVDSLWARSGTLTPGDVLAITNQLLDVLAAAHAKGILHRDLKPENLFLTKDGQLKVLDFGIARLRELTAGQDA